MKENKKNMSVKSKVIIIFILAILVTISGIGYMIIDRWLSSAEQITGKIAGDISDSIYNQSSSFLHVPYQINEANRIILENDMLDLSDDKLRNKFFVGVLSSYSEEVYSFSYGTVNGEYYGASRNKDGVIQIIKNDSATGGSSWYYSVNADFTAGGLVLQTDKYDPRKREWYKAAESTGVPTISPIYKHLLMGELTVSAACPIYDNNGKLRGVLGTHLLLSNIGSYLSDTINKYNGYAIIIEKSTGALVANSMDIDNTIVLPDGTLKLNKIEDIGHSDIQLAYANYNNNGTQQFIHDGDNEKHYVNIREITMEDNAWILISSIPEGIYMDSVEGSIYQTFLFVVLALILILLISNGAIDALIKPMYNLLQISAELASGDLSKRVEVVRKDEIGLISESFNKVAEEMEFLFSNLEATVKVRTEELHKVNATLEDNKNQLQLILDSTDEAIFGMDTNGILTFCNNSCIKVLRYNNQEDLLGENMHQKIHINLLGDSPIKIEECKIIQAINSGESIESDDEVFWRADGTSFDVEYHAHPQTKNGEVIGGVISFKDITDRKKREEDIKYLSSYDTLTGLHNRRSFEDNLATIDMQNNLPLSVIFADINGLKMTNDIFGHTTGDALIKKSAEILTQSCRDNDVIARVGGDEFIILLPNTDRDSAEKIKLRITTGFSSARIAAIKCSISLGIDTKVDAKQQLDEVLANAENAMYKEKTMNRQFINNDIIDNIIETLHSKSAKEKRHSIAVGELCGEVGSALNLSALKINRLKRAGYLHDIGKITLDESLISKETLTEEEFEKIRQHTAIGYRILSLFDDTLDLAEYIYSHHERWDGYGYPRGLSGEQIPLISRVLSIAETYDRVLNRGNLPLVERNRAAIKIIKEGAGKQFDPEIAELFVRMMDKKFI